MQNIRSHLLLVFGLAAHLISASLLQTAAKNVSTPTTLMRMTSASHTDTQSVTDSDIILTAALHLSTSTTVDIMMSTTSTDARPAIDSDIITTALMGLATSTTLDAMVSASPTAIQSLSDKEKDILAKALVAVPTLTTLDTITSASPTANQSLTGSGILAKAPTALATPTTLDTIISASPTANQSLSDKDKDILASALVAFPPFKTFNTVRSASPTTNRSLSYGDVKHTVSASPSTNRSLTHGNITHTVVFSFTTSAPSSTMIPANTTDAQSATDSDLPSTTPVDLPTSTTSGNTPSAIPADIQDSKSDPLPPPSDNTTSATPADIEDSEIDESFYPIPGSTLSIISKYKVPTPTPGSVAILNGIPTLVLHDPVKEAILLDADTLDGDDTPSPGTTTNFYQTWNTSYPGPIHDGDWHKYLQIWDPTWWSLNLDSLRQTSCLCSHDDFLTNPDAQLAAYMNFKYYSHVTGAIYSLDWICGPVASAMDIPERITSWKGHSEHCWQAAGGEYAGDHTKFPEISGYYCDEKEELCVEPWRDGKRALTLHGHRRFYDRHGTHTWSEIQPVVRDVCQPICEDKFLMRFDDMSHHNPSFVTTYYPPKPVDLSIIGD